MESQATTLPGAAQLSAKEMVINALAKIRAQETDEVFSDLSGDGDGALIDSKEAEVIISVLQVQLELDLGQVEDIGDCDEITLDLLAAHIERCQGVGQ
ncbi:MAG: hypothetical protein GKR94_16025 [Gammaproteobacteria bacterium]|nr:hypothetical protein [Gammaproteobacteria bacterium]